MIDLNARSERALKQLTGNETLLDMLDTESATEMLNWGMAMTRRLVNETGTLDDAAADAVLEPRLKAIRQAARSIGNWAGGKYTDPASRIRLRDKLIEYFHTVYGEETLAPSSDALDQVLNQVDDKTNTSQQLVLKLKNLVEGQA